MVGRLAWEAGELAVKATFNSLRKSLPKVGGKGLEVVKASLLPEATGVAHIAKKGFVEQAAKGVVGAQDKIDLIKTGSQIAEMGWWAKTLAHLGGVGTDVLQLSRISTSFGANETSATEQVHQIGAKGLAATLNTASIAVRNPLAKLGLRVAGIGVGFGNDLVESALESSRGKHTMWDKYFSFFGKGSPIETLENGQKVSSFGWLRDWYLAQDVKSGVFNYGRAATLRPWEIAKY